MGKAKFVASLIEKLTTTEVAKHFKTTGADLAALVGKDPKVSIGGKLVASAVAKGGSKVGGKPDVDNTFQWPHEPDNEDEPLQFIAQLNLAEVHPHDFDNKLPAHGMVWLFSIADCDRAYGGEVDSTTTKVLFSSNPGPLEPHDIPETLFENEDATIEERKIEFGPAVSTYAIGDSGLKDYVKEAAAELGGRYGAVYMLGAVKDADEPTFMLASLDMYTIAPNAFGEGILSFTLTDKDLKDGAITNADTVYNGGT